MAKFLETFYPITESEVRTWFVLWTYWYYGMPYLVTCVGSFY